MTFDYSLDFTMIDFRAHPELYRIGKGEQGVLLVEPYKSEILPHWRFRTPKFCGHGYGAKVSADGLHKIAEIRKPQIGSEVCRRKQRGTRAGRGFREGGIGKDILR
jgi:hypothetical protein